MSNVIVGGHKYIRHDKVDFFYQKLHKLHKLGKPVENVFDEPVPKELKLQSLSNQDLLMEMVRRSGLSNMCVHLFGVLYDEITKQYMSLIDEFRIRNPTDAAKIGLHESKDARPANYTSSAARLANTMFTGLNVQLKGFCPKEPLVRLRLLLQWPIERFADFSIQGIDVPERPQSVEGKASTDNLYTRMLELQPKMKEWENYYFQVCKSVEQLCDKLKKGMPSNFA